MGRSVHGSKVPPEWQGPFIFLNQPAAKELSIDPALPLWLRVVYAAYGNVSANGHAPFRRRVLGAILGEKIDGVWVEASPQQVFNHVKMAVSKGMLERSSTARCLVVHRSLVAGGLGEPDAPCPQHSRRRGALTLVREQE